MPRDSKRNEKLIPRASSYSNGKMNNYPFRVLSLFQKKNTGRISIQIERFVAFLKLWSPWNSPRDWNQRWIPSFQFASEWRWLHGDGSYSLPFCPQIGGIRYPTTKETSQEHDGKLDHTPQEGWQVESQLQTTNIYKEVWSPKKNENISVVQRKRPLNSKSANLPRIVVWYVLIWYTKYNLQWFYVAHVPGQQETSRQPRNWA